MLTEVPHVRQISGEGPRRWFCDDYFDLIVWYEEEAITGFQLCYDPNGHPRAYTWTQECGARHDGIDDGESSPEGRKATPILVRDGAFDSGAVVSRFNRVSNSLPPDIREVVMLRLEEERIRMLPGKPRSTRRLRMSSLKKSAE